METENVNVLLHYILHRRFWSIVKVMEHTNEIYEERFWMIQMDTKEVNSRHFDYYSTQYFEQSHSDLFLLKSINRSQAWSGKVSTVDTKTVSFYQEA